MRSGSSSSRRPSGSCCGERGKPWVQPGPSGTRSAVERRPGEGAGAGGGAGRGRHLPPFEFPSLFCLPFLPSLSCFPHFLLSLFCLSSVSPCLRGEFFLPAFLSSGTVRPLGFVGADPELPHAGPERRRRRAQELRGPGRTRHDAPCPLEGGEDVLPLHGIERPEGRVGSAAAGLELVAQGRVLPLEDGHSLAQGSIVLGRAVLETLQGSLRRRDIA